MNIKHKLKQIVTNKLFLSIIAIAVIVTAALITIQKVRTINDTERIALDEFTNRILPYLDEIDYDGEDASRAEDNYISFAMEYNFGENNKTEMTAEDIKKLTKDTFDYDLNLEELEHNPVSTRFMNKYISYNQQDKTFVIDRQYINKQLVAITPITKYIERDAYKSSGNFIVKYSKYQFETPYKILDCAAQNNIPIPDFDDYINGTASAASLKRAVNQDCADKSASKIKDITVTYASKDGHLYIKDIK